MPATLPEFSNHNDLHNAMRRKRVYTSDRGQVTGSDHTEGPAQHPDLQAWLLNAEGTGIVSVKPSGGQGQDMEEA